MTDQKNGGSSPGRLTNREIRRRVAQKAHELYEMEGKIPGREVENWLEAARIVMGELGNRDPRNSLIVSLDPRRFDVKFLGKED